MREEGINTNSFNFIDFFIIALGLLMIILFIASWILGAKVKDLPPLMQIEAELKLATIKSFAWASLILTACFSLLDLILMRIVVNRKSMTSQSVKQYKTENVIKKEVSYSKPTPKPEPVQTQARWTCSKCGYQNIDKAFACINCGQSKFFNKE